MMRGPTCRAPPGQSLAHNWWASEVVSVHGTGRAVRPPAEKNQIPKGPVAAGSLSRSPANRSAAAGRTGGKHEDAVP